MPPPKSTLPQAAKPRCSEYFDAWNSSSTGHQRAENRLGGSTEWRQSRSTKLSHQFKSGGTGGAKHISDTVGAGSEDWDEHLKALVPKDVRNQAKNSIGNILMGRTIKLSTEEKLMDQRQKYDDLKEEKKLNEKRGIFYGLAIYINGSTHPVISDHRLKHLLAENGAKLSQHLGRRSVTHVILGRPSGTSGQGAGGGLSGTKIEKEIRKIGGCGVKYVGVEWVLESIKAGKRLSETQFTNLKIAPKGQGSVYSIFKSTSTSNSR